MQPTSDAQFAASADDSVPPLEEVRDGIYCYGLRQPGTLPHYTLSYLILDASGAVHVIDAGWDSDTNWATFCETLDTLGRSISDVASVTVTHLHPDHLGMAGRIREASGAPVAIHRAEQEGIRELSTPLVDADVLERLEGWGVPGERRPELLAAAHQRGQWPSFTADRLLSDGEVLDIPGRSVRALHTPGHTTGHLAFVDESDEVVLLGDLLLPNQFPGIGLGGTPSSNPIDDYLTSLDTVSRLDAFEALPGHGYRFRGVAARCAETAAHHEKRTAEVAAALHPDATVWDLAAQLTWTAGWENLQGLPLLSALSQTALHAERAGRVGTAGV
ncbi:MAG: MBL fold metallo-hydrolase [Cryobacterium sp.]|nr:MBL fold metallo-hydrolase [Cryobacterium sp.]